jgi:hypothetical protein
MNIIYRKFKEDEIQEIDNLFTKSMLSACPNLLYSFLIIAKYYGKFLFPGYLISWMLDLNLDYLFIYSFLLLSFLLYLGVKIFLYIFVQKNLPSKNMITFTKKGSFLFVAYDTEKQKIIGFNSVRDIGNNSGWMDYHFVDPEYFKKRIGLNLIIEIWNFCKENGYVLDNKSKINYIDVYGGTSSLQIGFWKKYATTVTLQSKYIIFGYKINKTIIDHLPIRGYDIHFNYLDFQKKIKNNLKK